MSLIIFMGMIFIVTTSILSLLAIWIIADTTSSNPLISLWRGKYYAKVEELNVAEQKTIILNEKLNKYRRG